MLLITRPLTAAALARVVMTMTEGKSAALQRLAVPSRHSTDLATGTGTDQFSVAAPLDGGAPLTSASPHVKLGELIGVAGPRCNVVEALRWQNGLEASYTRGVFHALGRYGVNEATFFDDMTRADGRGDLELLRKNSKAALFEPLVGAAAHALAAVLDRVRHGTLPSSVAGEATGPAGGDDWRRASPRVRIAGRSSARGCTRGRTTIPSGSCWPPSRSAGPRSGARIDECARAARDGSRDRRRDRPGRRRPGLSARIRSASWAGCSRGSKDGCGVAGPTATSAVSRSS